MPRPCPNRDTVRATMRNFLPSKRVPSQRERWISRFGGGKGRPPISLPEFTEPRFLWSETATIGTRPLARSSVVYSPFSRKRWKVWRKYSSHNENETFFCIFSTRFEWDRNWNRVRDIWGYVFKMAKIFLKKEIIKPFETMEGWDDSSKRRIKIVFTKFTTRGEE